MRHRTASTMIPPNSKHKTPIRTYVAFYACVSLTLLSHPTEAFAPSSQITPSSSLHATTVRHHDDASGLTERASRREVFTKSAAVFASIAVGTLGTAPGAAVAAAAGKGPSPDELKRIQTGYERITYLLDNWEKETTVCRDNGGECKRDAQPVRAYLGLRYTTDPLFQIEKVFNKVKYMDIDSDNLEPFFEAAEDWNAAVTMSNSMAFISQFGEYNPGGGKDEVLKYLDEAQKQVILAKSALGKVMTTLSL